MHSGHQMKIRIPVAMREWLEEEAARNLRSMNAEIVMSVRDRMERLKPTTGERLQADAPAAGHHSTALQGGPATQALEMPR